MGMIPCGTCRRSRTSMSGEMMMKSSSASDMSEVGTLAVHRSQDNPDSQANTPSSAAVAATTKHKLHDAGMCVKTAPSSSEMVPLHQCAHHDVKLETATVAGAGVCTSIRITNAPHSASDTHMGTVHQKPPTSPGGVLGVAACSFSHKATDFSATGRRKKTAPRQSAA